MEKQKAGDPYRRAKRLLILLDFCRLAVEYERYSEATELSEAADIKTKPVGEAIRASIDLAGSNLDGAILPQEIEVIAASVERALEDLRATHVTRSFYEAVGRFLED